MNQTSLLSQSGTGAMIDRPGLLTEAFVLWDFSEPQHSMRELQINPEHRDQTESLVIQL